VSVADRRISNFSEFIQGFGVMNKEHYFCQIFKLNSMKVLNLMLGLLSISVMLLSSCNELENINLTDVSAPLESEFVVFTTDSTVEKVEFIDASTNSDYVNNRSKIDDVEITRLEYQIKSINPTSADSLIEGRFEFLNPVTNAYETLSNVNNKKLKLNISYEMPFDPIVAQKMIGVFKSSDPKVQIRFKASANKKPVDFLIALKLYLKLKVKI